MKGKKSIIILSISMLVLSLLSYITFATGNNKTEDKNPLEFGLFASENIQLFGNGTLNGEIWANNFIGIEVGTEFTIQSNSWSSNDIGVKGTSNPGEDYNQSPWRNDGLSENDKHNIITKEKEMPKLMDILRATVEMSGKYEDIDGDFNFTELNSESSYIVTGNITGSVPGDLNSSLIADGNISIALNNSDGWYKKEDASGMKPIIIATDKKDGVIKINGNSFIVGTIYAPEGTVEINGAGICIVGNIIAQNIRISGSGLYVNDENKIIFKEDL